nr:hypothetical protein [Lentibacillus sp. CBA3610]
MMHTPILIDKYLTGHSKSKLMPSVMAKRSSYRGIMEHIERQVLFIGDSIAVYPHSAPVML